jgi:hypothetical protein
MHVRWYDKDKGRYRHGFVAAETLLGCEVKTVQDCEIHTVLVERDDLRPMPGHSTRRPDFALIADLEERTEANG